jgi:hypothetical protein
LGLCGVNACSMPYLGVLQQSWPRCGGKTLQAGLLPREIPESRNILALVAQRLR